MTKPHRVQCPSCEASFDLNKFTKPRSLEQHRRFFAMIKAAFHHWPEAHDHQFSDQTECRKWLTMKAGYRTLALRMPMSGVKPDAAIIIATASMKAAGAHAVALAHKGSLCIWTPKSIRFDKMSHLEFCALSDSVAEVIKAEMGITADELLDQTERAA